MEVMDSSRSTAFDEVTLDLDRQRRCGFPEVIYGEGKTVQILERIFARLLDNETDVLATRVAKDKAELLTQRFTTAVYNEAARTFRIASSSDSRSKCGFVAVVTAGTSDFPVAEEALETLDWMNVNTHAIHDVGVAGPHRLPERLGEFEQADAIVVAAGLEGALPSVVGGYVACPVIAVPTSVGYGASFGGVAALLGMLNSCASNVTVVNIDAGFKAGYVAGLIARNKHSKPNDE
jgi:NCAIR mutase (PurE)-related protein